MKGELVRVQTEDGLELVGFYASPAGRAPRRAVLHVHGLSGNFYENRFVSVVGEAVVARGLSFLTLNNRGHDYVSDNLKGSGRGTTVVQGGASWDVFDDCAKDIAAGERFLVERGHVGIYFEGHSLGAIKVVHYLNERRDARALGLILLAPPDIFGLREAAAKEPIEGLLRRARTLVDAGEGGALMPEAGYVVPLSAETFVSMYGDERMTGIFPFRRGQGGDYRKLAAVRVPILVSYGTLDHAAVVPPDGAAELVRAKAVGAPRVEIALFAGADHVYLGSEEDLGRAVAAFVEP